MPRPNTKCIGAVTFYFVLFGCLGRTQDQTTTTTLNPNQQKIVRMAEEVRKQIVTLPQYGVFDHIHFAIKGTDTVVLEGQASRPTLKSSAEKVVKQIEGVTTVHNQIQVLPVSPNDDRIRAAVYASIYGYPALQKYTSNRGGPRGRSIARAAGGITNDPPIGFHAIHIIVENGNVTLTGVVNNDSDLAIAGMRANVPGVFSVDNDLQVASQG
jgi:hyperosmotically inducible periplasmic protein